MNMKDRDVVSIGDFTVEEIEGIIEYARKMVPIAKGEKKSKALDGKILSTLFFEPSTRTKLSFESAMLRLGGGILGFANPKGTSATKGETLADTIRMAEAYSDVIVLRHPREGAARLAAKFSQKPVINAGDGAGQHPTQTLLDLFTIKTEKGTIGDININLVGDLKYGRTVHSLAHALAMFGANLTFTAPEDLQMPPHVIKKVEKLGVRPKISYDLEESIGDSDVLYVTRIQKERFPDLAEYEKVAGAYRVDMDLLEKAKEDMIIMHPLPRVNEIAPEVDETPHAKYFVQAFNGVPVRMALLSLVLGVEI
jgi:aspartate carbamoyltransferase catalytic subunit